MKREYLYKAISSFSENLMAVNYMQKDNLFFLVLSYILDFLKGSRASFLRYEKESDILYNKRTIIYKDGNPVFDDIDNKLKYISINIRNDVRNKFLRDSRMLVLNVIESQDELSMDIDEKLGIKPAHVMIYPMYFQSEFLGTIEVIREDSDSAFDEEEQIYFSMLLNLASTLLTNFYLYEWAIRDTLTDCFAITYFNKIMDELIVTTTRGHEAFTILLMDIDNFKKLNDIYGHQAGDRAIRFFAEAIGKFLRQDFDVLARFSGDEFCLLLKNCNLEKSTIVAHRILDYLRNNALELENVKVNMTTSIGIAQYIIHGSDRETLLKSASDALRKSKDKGKNCYTIYSPK
jgi:diguanylate cyclase (GGDEF)-like protein